MRRAAMLLAGLAIAAGPAPAGAVQCPATATPSLFPANASGVRIAIDTAHDALLFRLRKGQMNLDLDGNEHTYGVKDQGIDGICNGLSALKPPQCAGVTPHGDCVAACKQALRAWDGSPVGAKKLFCSVGLGSGCGQSFSAPRQAPPNEDFFVSETAAKYVRPADAPANWAQTQAAQIDPLKVAYFVVPPALRKLPFDASLGDAGVMIRADRARPPVFFIIGDSGNNGEIGESSGRLHELLSTQGALPTKPETSAFGQQVARVQAGASPEVVVAIFRHSATRPAGAASQIKLTPDTINEWIGKTGADRLDRLGGADTLAGCAPALR